MEEKMECDMIVRLADNVTSPLGFTTADNYRAVLDGRSELRVYDNRFGVRDSFCASLFDRNVVDEVFASLCQCPDNYTFFEKICIISASDAISKSGVNVKSGRVLFVLSTTKGNVSLLDERIPGIPENRVLLAEAAKSISHFFGNPNKPVVVSNACISGVCAQIAASRFLKSGRYDHVVVIGADCQSKFIVTGFQSFKALSLEPCKPYDSNRKGLNLGEAAATIVYGRKEEAEITSNDWILRSAAIRNDANHISGPSRTGEGSFLALKSVIKDFDIADIAFVNAHGTSTMYNDEMESIAIYRAGLVDKPVTSLKGYYGHTMGAAGVLETILSFHAVDNGKVIATRGYENCGVTYPLSVSAENRTTDHKSFIKLMSGFGGCNAAVLFSKGGKR